MMNVSRNFLLVNNDVTTVNDRWTGIILTADEIFVLFYLRGTHHTIVDLYVSFATKVFWVKWENKFLFWFILEV